MNEIEDHQVYKHSLETAIAASSSELYHYDLRSAMDTVVNDFGHERVSWVLAVTLQQFGYDGRYSSVNKEWARTFSVSSTIPSSEEVR